MNLLFTEVSTNIKSLTITDSHWDRTFSVFVARLISNLKFNIREMHIKNATIKAPRDFNPVFDELKHSALIQFKIDCDYKQVYERCSFDGFKYLIILGVSFANGLKVSKINVLHLHGVLFSSQDWQKVLPISIIELSVSSPDWSNNWSPISLKTYLDLKIIQT
jgi:hypothetical protein